MPDYETMYKKLFNSVTDAIEMLQEAQKKAEEKYVESSEHEESKIKVLSKSE